MKSSFPLPPSFGRGRLAGSRRYSCLRSHLAGLLILALAVSPLAVRAVAGWVDVRDYFPAGWQEERLDLRDYIQQAVNENARVFFPGSNDADNPIFYHVTPTIEVPEHHWISFGPHHRVVRIPSRGRLFSLQSHARMEGAVIDGNKYAHWPEFEDMGKQNDTAVRMASHCLVKDVVVFNNPGHAFESWSDYNKVYRCRAENVGYIDVKFGVMFYQGNRDRWSADGFYFRGTGNLIKDSEAFDAQRWAFCSSHSGARQNTYVDCRGGDIEFTTYGFIDIEGADANNRLIRCISPNSHIAIPGSRRTEVIQCMASHISAYDSQNPDTVEMYGGLLHAPLLDGNITTEGGIVLGGWSNARNQQVPGAQSPIVTNNRMYKTHDGPTDGYSDWSFSVYSTDGHGVVANNILFEYDDGENRGPGMNIEGVEGHNNQVLYGQWDLDLPRLSFTYGYYEMDQINNRFLERADEDLQVYLQAEETISATARVHWLPLEAQFVKEQDLAPAAVEAAATRPPEPGQRGLMTMPLTSHWDFYIGSYHRRAAWYYVRFDLPAGVSADDDLYLYFAGIDSEAEIFLNGRKIGEHSGWDKPSRLALSRADLQAGDNDSMLLALRVWTPGGLGGVYGPIALLAD